MKLYLNMCIEQKDQVWIEIQKFGIEKVKQKTNKLRNLCRVVELNHQYMKFRQFTKWRTLPNLPLQTTSKPIFSESPVIKPPLVNLRIKAFKRDTA